jgi:co-chaperonin GroES (HSP10)
MNYQPIVDAVVIRAEKNKRAKKTFGEVNIIIETKYDQWGYATVDGEVAGVPKRLSKGGEINIEVGDHVYCHHFLTSEQNEVGPDWPDLWKIDYRELYCKVKGDEITMLGEWNFCDPIIDKEAGFDYEKDDESGLMHKKTSSGIIIDINVKSDTKWSVLRHLSKEAEEYGLKPGDKILYRKDCDYEMEVEGHKFFRIRTKDILLVNGRE